MDELELKIEKLIKDQILITESEAQDLATLICNLPEINGGRVGAGVMPNEVLAGGIKRWKPKEKEIFYYVNFYTGVTEQVYTNSKIHTPRNLYKIGNCYKTKEEAQTKWDQIKQILLQR